MAANLPRLSRRTLLRGVGATVALPFLEAMAPGASLIRTTASVTATSAPKRMAFFYVPNGMHMPDWRPTDFGKEFELPKILKPFEAHREKMNVLSNLTLNGARALGDGGGDHARSVASFLTGAHPKKTSGKNIQNGVSIDQHVASKIGEQTRFPSLEMGMERSARAGRCDSGYSCVYTSNIAWRNETSPVSKEVDPSAIFDRLFGSKQEQLEHKRDKHRADYRKSILDLVREDAKDLQRQLGKADNRKLDEYLHAIREIETRLARTDRLDQTEVDVPDYPRPKGVPREYEQHLKLLMDMMVLAFQTDSTRIGSLMYANAGSNRSYRNLGIRSGHHEISHHGGNREKQEQISKINQYHASLFAYFLDRLDRIDEGGKSILDNSMIVYGSGIADGNRHDHHGLPIAMFGSAGGEIKTGRHIKIKRETPLTNLYVSMADKMGVDADGFSDSNGRLKELDS